MPAVIMPKATKGIYTDQELLDAILKCKEIINNCAETTSSAYKDKLHIMEAEAKRRGLYELAV